MAMNDDRDQIRDLMNIESFAQLPFIRPTPPVRGKIIRLFGKEFKGSRENSTTEENSSEREEIVVKDSAGNNETDLMSGITSNVNRRFECPYCCRNFHTSQALGGHQNAHKRERQQEKRAHMHAMEAQYGGGLSDARVYNGAVHAVIPLAANSYYHTIVSGNASHSCFCKGCSTATHHQPQPINGSPLTAALWRRVQISADHSSSAFESERSMMYHRLRSLDPKDESSKQFSSMNSDHQRRRLGRYNLSKRPAGMKDQQVSLDLRL